MNTALMVPRKKRNVTLEEHKEHYARVVTVIRLNDNGNYICGAGILLIYWCFMS